MKFITLILVVASLPLSSLEAQTSIAFQGGLNVANLSDPGNLVPGAVWSTRLGFVGTVSIDLPLGSRVSISPGLRFVQKGTKSDWALWVTGRVQTTLTNNYLELPIYAKYSLLSTETRLSILLGPSLGYLLSSQTSGSTQYYGPFSHDVKEDYKRYDLSLDAGFEIQTPVNHTISLVGAATYSFGLVKISQKGSNEQTRDIRLTIGAAYSLD